MDYITLLPPVNPICLLGAEYRASCSAQENFCGFETSDLRVLFPHLLFLVFPPVQSQHCLCAKLGQGATSAQLEALPCMAGRQGFTAHQGANEKQYGQGIMYPDLTSHETQSANHFSPVLCSAFHPSCSDTFNLT